MDVKEVLKWGALILVFYVAWRWINRMLGGSPVPNSAAIETQTFTQLAFTGFRATRHTTPFTHHLMAAGAGEDGRGDSEGTWRAKALIRRL
jgi:hypothetical protein